MVIDSTTQALITNGYPKYHKLLFIGEPSSDEEGGTRQRDGRRDSVLQGFDISPSVSFADSSLVRGSLSHPSYTYKQQFIL